MIGLTARQLSLLRWIIGYQEAHGGVSPSYKEMALHHGGRACAHERILALEERGYLKRLPNRARAIEVLRYVEIPRGPSREPLYWVPVAGLPVD